MEEKPEAGIAVLRLEGKLVQPWVDELRSSWKVFLAQLPRHGPIQVDLNAVSFVDEDGRAMLTSLYLTGCQLDGSGPYIASVIEECMGSRASCRRQR
jgi:ABC-type transporter Mla MlaB component